MVIHIALPDLSLPPGGFYRLAWVTVSIVAGANNAAVALLARPSI